MPITDYCQREVRTIDQDQTLRAAARQMAGQGVGSLVVLHGSRPCGIVTDRDVTLKVLHEGVDPDDTRLRDVVPPDPVVVHGSTHLRVAAGVMRRRAIRRLIVVDDREQLLGIIALDDLVPLLADELAGVAKVIRSQKPASPAPAPGAQGGAA